MCAQQQAAAAPRAEVGLAATASDAELAQRQEEEERKRKEAAAERQRQAGGAGGADAAARAVEEALVEGGRKINCGRCQLVDQGRAGRGYQYLGFWLDAGLTLDEEATPVANKLVGGGARAAAMGTRPVS